MEKIRSALPLILEATGAAATLLFLGIAGLSVGNPLEAVVFLVVGLAVGSLLFAAGYFLRLAAEATARLRQVQGDVRSLGNAVLKILRRDEE